MDVVSKNSEFLMNLFDKFAWLISSAVVSRKFQKVALEISCSARSFHT